MQVTVAAEGAISGSGTVKSVPAHPEDEAAKGAEGDVVTGNRVDLDDLSILILLVFTDSRSQNLCADQGGDAADHMNCTGAGKIMEADL